MKRRVNSHSEGQTRFFGPTSSLHLTETPSSISHYGSTNFVGSDIDVDHGISEPLQTYLLDLYWQYQHSVLPVVHREAFLAGVETGRGPYYSRCLLLCILASGARISGRPEIRALAIPTEDCDKDEPRPLMKQAEDALEKEISNPTTTTIQSLLLLSVLYCIQSNDSKGWMLSGTALRLFEDPSQSNIPTGNACRLVFDLGLHEDWAYISAQKFSQLDVEVRQVVFWGCFILDRYISFTCGLTTCLTTL